ncbi:hypothetical protein DER46DRAFT_578218 [Fusarium sp. MPI-SDFR-AT-0072]|nr:hypothetical protein DER46DRAFT_578218 [Fusarium sp. MPI-SDFR-AT-0072]
MSQPTGDTPRRNVPFLPPELSLRIIEESEEAFICLVNHLSNGKLLCDGFQKHNTVIYTRGEKEKDGTLARGRLETLPMQHRCVAGTIQASDRPALPFDPSDDYSVKLKISHLTKRTVVAELGLDEDLVNPILSLDKHALPPYYEPYRLLNFPYAGYAFLDRRFIETVPVLIGGEDVRHLAGITMSQTALTHRLRPIDEKLACEKIKHLMIRHKDFSAADLLDLSDQLKKDLITVRDVLKWEEALINYRAEILGSVLCPKWELLKSLETLCIDMTDNMRQLGTTEYVRRSKATLLGIQINKMSRHLNLKTLILLGVPCLARYDFQTAYWPGPVADVVALTDGLQ